MNYCLIDESDENDQFETEGEILSQFFKSSQLFNRKNSLEIFRTGQNIEDVLKRRRWNKFNIVHFGAHGWYNQATDKKMDSSSFLRRTTGRPVEIFKHDSVVRTGLVCDVFLSTNCLTFNPAFTEILQHYKGVKNYIAPIDCPYI